MNVYSIPAGSRFVLDTDSMYEFYHEDFVGGAISYVRLAASRECEKKIRSMLRQQKELFLAVNDDREIVDIFLSMEDLQKEIFPTSNVHEAVIDALLHGAINEVLDRAEDGEIVIHHGFQIRGNQDLGSNIQFLMECMEQGRIGFKFGVPIQLQNTYSGHLNSAGGDVDVKITLHHQRELDLLSGWNWIHRECCGRYSVEGDDFYEEMVTIRVTRSGEVFCYWQLGQPVLASTPEAQGEEGEYYDDLPF